MVQESSQTVKKVFRPLMEMAVELQCVFIRLSIQALFHEMCPVSHFYQCKQSSFSRIDVSTASFRCHVPTGYSPRQHIAFLAINALGISVQNGICKTKTRVLNNKLRWSYVNLGDILAIFGTEKREAIIRACIGSNGVQCSYTMAQSGLLDKMFARRCKIPLNLQGNTVDGYI